jgi:hypothetical protein
MVSELSALGGIEGQRLSEAVPGVQPGGRLAHAAPVECGNSPPHPWPAGAVAGKDSGISTPARSGGTPERGLRPDRSDLSGSTPTVYTSSRKRRVCIREVTPRPCDLWKCLIFQGMWRGS